MKIKARLGWKHRNGLESNEVKNWFIFLIQSFMTKWQSNIAQQI